MSVEKEDVGAFDGCRTVDFRDLFSVNRYAVRNRRFTETCNETQFPNFWFGACIGSDIQCVNTRFYNVIVRLIQIKYLMSGANKLLKAHNSTGPDCDNSDVVCNRR